MAKTHRMRSELLCIIATEAAYAGVHGQSIPEGARYLANCLKTTPTSQLLRRWAFRGNFVIINLDRFIPCTLFKGKSGV